MFRRFDSKLKLEYKNESGKKRRDRNDQRVSEGDGVELGKEPSERGRLAQREDLEKCQRMEGEDLLMPTRILFRLEIRKYLGLFYIAPSFWKREKETTGERDGGGGSFKSKIEWKAPSLEGGREEGKAFACLASLRDEKYLC